MNDDLTGRRLGDSLRDHVPAHPLAPVGLADVKASAQRIRRRRAITGMAGTALAATVIISAGFLGLSGNDQVAPPVAPPVPTPTQTPTPLPLTAVALTADSPRGSDAEEWFVKGAVNAGLPPEALPDDTDHVARLGEHWLISFYDEESQEWRLRVMDASNGGVIQEFVQSAGFAISDDHDLAAFTTPQGELRLLDDSGTSRVLATLPDKGEPPRPIDVMGGAGCVDGSTTTECRVVLDHVAGQGPITVTEGGKIRQIDSEAEFVDAISGPASDNSLVALRDPNTPRADAPCARVVELTGEQWWERCDVAVQSFSPDGRWAQVVDSQQSGWGPSRVGIVNAATGELLFWIDPEAKDAGIGAAVWEGSEHLVVSTYDFAGQEWRLFRVSTRGEVEQAADHVEDDDQAFPFIPPVLP